MQKVVVELLKALAIEVLIPVLMDVVDDIVDREDNTMNGKQGEKIKKQLLTVREATNGS